MDAQRRRASAEEVLARFVLGPAAATHASRQALDRLDDPRAVLVVEGVSDQIAIEVLAGRLGVDLPSVRAAVVPIGGAHAMARGVAAVAVRWPKARLGTLCDRAEETVVRAGLARYSADPGRVGSDRPGFLVCDPDLEGELLTALGIDDTMQCIKDQGDLGALRSLQRQPAWRDRPLPLQLRRFVRSVARRNMRYAVALTEAIPLERMPRPLTSAVRLLDQT